MFLSNLEYYKDDFIEIIYIQRITHYWPLHSHPADYQILLVFDGELNIEYKDEVIILYADDFLVIPPYKAHVEASGAGIKVLSLNVNKDAVEQDGSCVLNLIDDIVEKLQARGLVETRHIISLSKAASQILYIYRRREDECTEFVAQAREMLEKWPEKEISLDEMAELVRVCRGHLVRTFRKEVGLTPHQFQIQARVQRAIRLLIDSDLPIEEISHKCGFYDKNHFKRHFRRFLGMTPKEYRKAFQGAKRLLL